MGGDFSRVVDSVSTDGKSYTFGDSLLRAYVYYNLDVCHHLVFRICSWNNELCHVCALDVVKFVSLSKSAKFIIYSIVPSVSHLGVSNYMSKFLFFTYCWANESIDVCNRHSIRVDWINGIH